ncbi:DegT/DnrJ/EryC1/StrS family aminotransferase [Haloarcula sp. GH36]|uniref:DegT/DnrJ/EryC1/StrS family aminotransferase n=1 Tax=Haloarcula montana TaxID=3111776 RepID=UPI002D795F57|nr:DegT/DnrJ/EryC1/StrS family aminotransferase [Haloarcula sp. GH36]
MIGIADPEFGEAEQAAAKRVLESGRVADGPEVRAFESEFATVCETDHAVATANGTAALVAALDGLGIGDGDRVVTTPFSFVASSNAVRLVGAEPVFADIDPRTYNLDPDAARSAVRETDADAILAVHLYGLPAEMAALSDIATEEDVFLIEDAAQAHGARYQGQPVGSFGDAAAFSFYPTKNMTTGEGGMVVTDDEAVAERARCFINHGRDADGGPYAHERVGHNLRMTSLAAAIGREQLAKLPAWVEQRRYHAAVLSNGLDDVPGIEPPAEPSDAHHAYHQYTVRCDDRSGLRERLEAGGVGAAVYYPKPIHRLEAYEEYDATAPAAEAAAESVLSLPVHPGLTADEIDHVVETVSEAGLQVQ